MKDLETIQGFENVAQEIVEAIRLGDGLRDDSVLTCEQLLESLIKRFEGESAIPKRLAYALQVLRDNLIGGLSAYKGSERDRIAKANSYLDGAIERLLLG